METRQLAYFLLACQQHNHLAAAQELGIAASTLSENIARLEEELGLELFRLAPHGHYPTAEARALYQKFEHVLRALEAMPGIVRGAKERAKVLTVGTDLRFALGRISKAASLAARALRSEFPDIFFDIRFRAHDGAVSEDESDRELDLLIKYEGAAERRRWIPLCEDPWLVVSNSPQLRGARSITIESLQKITLSLPDLPPQLHAAAVKLCRQAGLSVPLSTNADIGALPRMSIMDEVFYLLVPQSTFSARLKHFKLHAARTPPGWTSNLIAVTQTRHPALNAYADKLCALLASPERNSIYRPQLTMRQLRYFLALHGHGNMTVAARKLGVAQPALSSQLRGLEKASRSVLFTRHRSGLAPTAEGNRLAYLFQDVVRRLDDAERTASRLATSHRHRMTVGVVPLAERGGVLVQSLIGAISEWRRAYPDVELRIHEAPTDTLHKWVLSGTASMALVETIVPHSARLDLKSRDPLGVLTAVGSGLLPSGDVRLQDIAKLPLILPSGTFGIRQLIDEAAAHAGFRLVPRAEVNSLVMAIAFVADGTLATVMPLGTIRRAMAAGELQFHKIVEPEIWRRLSIIYSTDRSLSEIERAFIQTLRRHLSDSK